MAKTSESPSPPPRKLGLKLFFLRTRERRISQTRMARDLGIRQATVSNLEQGLSSPGLALLKALSEYFGVSADYLIRDEIPCRPLPIHRLDNLGHLAAPAQYLEVPSSALHRLPQGTWLVALMAGTPAYDEEAARRRTQESEVDLIQAWRKECMRRQREDRALQEELDRERQRSRLRRRGVSRQEADRMLGPG